VICFRQESLCALRQNGLSPLIGSPQALLKTYFPIKSIILLASGNAAISAVAITQNLPILPRFEMPSVSLAIVFLIKSVLIFH
jgi:hypothetical protein